MASVTLLHFPPWRSVHQQFRAWPYDAVWDVTVFTKNRERLIEGAVSQQFAGGRCWLRRASSDLLSEEHFTVDGTLIQAWAAARSFKDKSDPPHPGEGSGHKGAVLLRDKVESAPIRMRVCIRKPRPTRRFRPTRAMR